MNNPVSNTAKYGCFCVLLSVIFFGVGCDTLNYTQYVVANASLADRSTIKKTLETAAGEAGLLDKTDTSTVPNTIAYYLEPVHYFPLMLGGRVVGDSAVIDLMQFHPGWCKYPPFKKAESVLTSTLTPEFGARLTMPDYKSRMPLPDYPCSHEVRGGELGSTYFVDASEIKFIASGKRITDKNAIAKILSNLDTSDKRRYPCQCSYLEAQVTLKNGKKVIVELSRDGWGFKEEIMLGNIRYLKDPNAFSELYTTLWDKYGPLSAGAKE